MSIRGPIRVNEFFRYRGGQLYAENVPVEQIPAAVGTPVYVYSVASFVEQYRALAAALAPVDPLICYALKANSNQAMLTLFASLGAGADGGSEGELRRALAAGIPAERIVFFRVGKDIAEAAALPVAGWRSPITRTIPNPAARRAMPPWCRRFSARSTSRWRSSQGGFWWAPAACSSPGWFMSRRANSGSLCSTPR